MEHIKTAEDLRLVNKALQILAAEDLAMLNKEERKQATELKLRLFLQVGQLRQVEAWLIQDREKLQEALGLWEYHVLRFQVAATLGNYDQADEYLEKLQGMNPTDADFVNEPTNAMQVMVAVNPWGAPFTHASLISVLAPWVYQEQSKSQVFAMRGVLALEHGDTTRAESFFGTALANWKGVHPLDFSGRMLAQGYLKLIEANKHKANN
jgi:hypothetical protein